MARVERMKYELVIVGALETNCYLIYCAETMDCVIVDPGADPEKIFPVVTELGLKPVILVNTHGHVDHVGANRDVKDHYSIPLCLHAADRPLLENAQLSELSLFLGAKESPPADRFLKDGDEIPFGRSRLRVIHTPGHSPGSISLRGDGYLFSGDTLFCEGVGRTDLPGGSWKDLEHSIKTRILVLPDDTVVLPGHGPLTTIGRERSSNPFLT